MQREARSELRRAGELHLVLLAERDFVQINQRNKDADKIEFEKFRNSTTFVMWKINFKIEVSSDLGFSNQCCGVE